MSSTLLRKAHLFQTGSVRQENRELAWDSLREMLFNVRFHWARVLKRERFEVSDETFGRLFCLEHKTGVLLYPVKIKNREDTRRKAFRISRGGTGGNTKAIGLEVDDEAQVLQKVVNDGFAVRVASCDRKVQGLYKLGQRSIVGYRKFYKGGDLRFADVGAWSCPIAAKPLTAREETTLFS